MGRGRCRYRARDCVRLSDFSVRSVNLVGNATDAVGRYTWRVTAGVLYFTLISDPCSRKIVYTDRGWTRTP
jgi:hypothetical protein